MAKGILISYPASFAFPVRPDFYWTTHARVGPGCANHTDDVQFVQLAYFCMASSPMPPSDAELMRLAGLIIPGQAYLGNPSEPLSQAIRRHQKVRGGVQDGKVSPISSTNGSYPNKLYMLIPLNTHIANILRQNVLPPPGNWPKLHMHPLCPAALAAVSRRIFPALTTPII